MRIHLQSHRSPQNFPLDQATWEAACARSPDISSGHQVTYGDDLAAFQAALPEVEVLIAQTAAMADMLAAAAFTAPRLRMVFCTSAGLEKLSPFDWLPEGVPVLNNRGTHAVKAGEYGIMALLMLASRIPAITTAQRDQQWLPLHGAAIGGRRTTIVGLGALGGSVATHAKHFGLHVTGIRNSHQPHPACDQVLALDSLDSVLPATEFLFLATPLTPATKNLLSRERIALLPKGAGIVNIGRGGLVDQDAVMDALDAGHLGGAILDVFTPEPVPPGHRLWTTPNLLMTPHVSADDPHTYNPRTLDIFFQNLRALRDGKPLPNRFDPARGY